MVWIVLIVVVVLCVIIYLFFKADKKENREIDRFVCDTCGESDCTCHKVPHDNHS